MTNGIPKLNFIVPGDPVGKGRPRFARGGKFVTTYTPDATTAYEHKVALYAKEAGAEPIAEHSVYLEIEASFLPPKSKPKWWKELANKEQISKTTKPDIDNIVKIVLDALNGIAYVDDCQVVEVGCIKKFSANPRLEVHMEYTPYPTRDMV